MNVVFRPSRTSFPSSRDHADVERTQTNFFGLILLSSISRRLSAPSSGADPALSNDFAKIRSGNGANPTPVHKSERAPRVLPASKTFSPFPPQRRLTPFPARDGISLLNRIKTIRELARPSGVARCKQAIAVRVCGLSALAIPLPLLNDLTPLSLTS